MLVTYSTTEAPRGLIQIYGLWRVCDSDSHYLPIKPPSVLVFQGLGKVPVIQCYVGLYACKNVSLVKTFGANLD